jgi:hypothetical protein
MELLREKIVKVRKVHSCFSCSDKINKGQKALSMTIVDDGIYNLYECMKCIIYKITNCMKCTNMECYMTKVISNNVKLISLRIEIYTMQAILIIYMINCITNN